MNQLVRYDAAKRAIAEYKSVDEVKDFRDKAVAIEAYARQANDFDLERDAAIARVRAERKCGQLLAQQEKARGSAGQLNGRDSSGGRVTRPLEDQPKTLSEMGVTKDQSSKWQKLAAVSDEAFEEAISQPGMRPTAGNVLSTQAPPKNESPPQMDESALWLWGRLRDMRSDGLFERSLADLVAEWTDGMRNDAIQIIPLLKKWVNDYDESA